MPLPLYHQYPFNERLGGSQSQSGRSREEKNLIPLPGFELLIVQPIASHCTGYSSLAPYFSLYNTIFLNNRMSVNGLLAD